MTEVRDVSADRQRNLSDEMEMRLGELVSSFAHEHGLSGLSAATLVLQMITVGVWQLGGPAARTYIQSSVDILSCSDARTASKINERARKAMQKMADHYDAEARAFAGRTLQ